MDNAIVPQGIACGAFPDDNPPVGTLTFEMIEGNITFVVDREALGRLKEALVLIEGYLDSLERPG